MEATLGYPGSPKVIPGPEKWKGQRQKSRSVMRRADPLEMGGGTQVVSTTGRSKEIGCPLEPSEGVQPCRYLDVGW